MLGLTRETGNGLTVSFVRTPDGQLIAATTGTSSAYYLTDNLGSTVGIVTNAGVKTAGYAYDPYGRTRTATGPSAASNAFRYAGGLYDTTTGATKFGARYYDPNTGRFTQPDPSGQEENPYAYTGNNPASYNDPTGLCGEWYSVYGCDDLLEDQYSSAETSCTIWGVGGGAVAYGVAAAAGGPIGWAGVGISAIGGCLMGYYDDLY